ncbi:hypothetical protein BGP77_12240 [Saccharospirillum sp. MSK14-1]|uniref:glyoxalase superfamily protein n=1 Tax=Saccharospirillum sp. MSK14-1 TaxID=1897632 RepID=UPI000D34F8E2|nr:glyoxalase superfamily protein [Saccharospirillum sp. MSK14-1]PTY38471.1 hypothetical protein BGP77_12240 [Saccharospirillum sp. MSK14-1]
MNEPLPTLAENKAQAKRLRQLMAEQGVAVSHSQSLELIAHNYGYRDWNTLSAQLNKQQSPVVAGSTVTGCYSGQTFRASVRSVQPERLGFWRVQLQLEQAMDVVTSSRFSSIRRRLTATINHQGVTEQTRGNGEPVLRLHPPAHH